MDINLVCNEFDFLSNCSLDLSLFANNELAKMWGKPHIESFANIPPLAPFPWHIFINNAHEQGGISRWDILVEKEGVNIEGELYIRVCELCNPDPSNNYGSIEDAGYIMQLGAGSDSFGKRLYTLVGFKKIS